MPTRRRPISPFFRFIHQPEFVAALWLAIFGAEALRRHHAWGAALLVAAIALFVRTWKKMKRDVARLRAEEPPAPAGEAIEPEAGIGLGSMIGVLFLVIAVAVEFHPYFWAALELFTPYRIVRVASDAPPPVFSGEVVWGRVQSSPPRRGQVRMIWARGPDSHERLVTVVATGGDTIRETRLVDWVERDLRDQPRWVNGVVAIPPPDFRPITVRAVPRGSLVVTGHVHPADDPISSR